MNYKLIMKQGVTTRVLLLDGLSRAGKMLVGPLVSNLQRMDYAQVAAAVDHIPILWRLGHMDDQTAAAFLRVTTDVYVYDRMIGRHLNMRPKDIWSCYKSLEINELMTRSVSSEGRDVMDAYNAEGRMQAFVTHEMLPHIDLWFAAYPDLRVQVTARHPVDVVDSWRRRNWGERWGEDPLAFIPVPETPGGPVPWFALDFAEAYLAMSPINRIVHSVTTLMELYDQALDALDPEGRAAIKVVSFERFAVDPVPELQAIADWLDTSFHARMPEAMAHERVPRELPVATRRAKLDQFRDDLTPESLDRLISASRDYEAQWGLDPVEP